MNSVATTMRVRPCLDLCRPLRAPVARESAIRSLKLANSRILQRCAYGSSALLRPASVVDYSAAYRGWWLVPCMLVATSLAHRRTECEGKEEQLQNGEWRQDGSRSESLAPFLLGLGVPRFAVIFVDAIRTDLNIICDGTELTVIDKTLFGSNTTRVTLGAAEVERATRTGRKKFMLSGFKDEEGRLTVQCRLFQRGDGWLSQQSWLVRPDGTLDERMLLKRPGEEDVVVTRTFNRKNDGQKQVLHASETVEAHVPAPTHRGNGRLFLMLGGAVLGLVSACAVLVPSRS